MNTKMTSALLLPFMLLVSPCRVTALGPVVTRSIAQLQCPLFQDGVQDPGTTVRVVLDYHSVFRRCLDQNDQDLLAIRRFTIEGEPFLLVAHPRSLETRVLRESCLRCSTIDPSTALNTRLIAAVERHSAGPWPLYNDGLKEAETPVQGSFFTGDLCPSRRAFDRSFLADLRRSGIPVAMGLAISGQWLRRHTDDFLWLKGLVAQGDARITWINHSYSHPYVEGVANHENFLLRPGIDLKREVLETERLLIAHGVTPSVFFRAPGLISNERLMMTLRQLQLIPLGANAWLAKGQKPRNGSVILVHVNGNEPLGLQRFENLAREGGLPLPFLPLSMVPAR